MPNVYYLNSYSRVSFVLLSIFGVILSLWPLIKLSWCKGENSSFLHDGQKGLVKLAYTACVVYSVSAIVFALSLSPAPSPNYMIFQAGVIFLYGAVHIFQCLLHFYMGLFDQN